MKKETIKLNGGHLERIFLKWGRNSRFLQFKSFLETANLGL